MQVPTLATGHEEKAEAAATGHEEAQATATGQVKKSAARCLSISKAPSSATGQSCAATVQDLQLRIQELIANEDYLGAAAVKVEMRALATLQVEGARGDEKSAAEA